MIAGRAAAPVLGAAVYAAFGAALAGVAFLAPKMLPMAGQPAWLAGVVLVLALAAGALLVFGPSRWMLTAFIGGMAAAHMHNSPFVLPFAGVEWHPRELLLLLLLAHAGFRLLDGRLRIPATPVHAFMAALALAWGVMAVGGLLRGNEMTNWIQEARFGLFVMAYVALLGLIHTPKSVFACAGLVLGVAIVAALGSIGLFAYTFATGELITNVQNWLGEYVRRQVGPFLLQSARPNPHMYFEAGTVVLMALLFSRGMAARWRIAILAVLVLFFAAIAITMMRTAYIATALSLVFLALASLPRPARAPVITLGLSLALLALVVFGALLRAQIEQAVPELGVSLRARVEETAGGLDVFQQHPLAGGGLGRTFEAMGYVAKETRESYGQATYLMVHNIWLYYLFKGGLITVTLAVFALGGLAFHGFRVADRLALPAHRAFTRGLAAALLGQAIASLAMPRFNYPTGLIYIALTAVALAVLGKASARNTAIG